MRLGNVRRRWLRVRLDAHPLLGQLPAQQREDLTAALEFASGWRPQGPGPVPILGRLAGFVQRHPNLHAAVDLLLQEEVRRVWRAPPPDWVRSRAWTSDAV